MREPKLTKKEHRKYKNGGYVKEEQFDDGAIIGLEMNAKGFFEEFAKPLLKDKKKNK